MKQNWEYKKIGDVCDYPNQRIAIKELCVGEYVGVENLVKNRGGLIRSTVMPDADNSIEFHIGDVLIGNIRPYLRKIWLADFNGGASGDVVVVRVKKEFENKLQPSYLYKVLSSEKFFEYDNSNTKGAKMPRGDRKSIAKFLIPVPPLSEQSRIVAELDLLTGIIDKQKTQLKELDTLAQSIFYDMFGDPIQNEKEWDMKIFSDVCEVTSSKRVYQSEWQDSGIPFYRISDFARLIESDAELDAELFISQNKYDELKQAKQVPKSGDILITARGTLGTCYIIKENDCFYFQDGMITWLKNLDDSVLSQFVVFLFKNQSFRRQIDKSQSGSTVAYLSISMLKKFVLPVPPLALQQSFADKIQPIENQKAKIKASIADTQKLLDYTMDKYFG